LQPVAIWAEAPSRKPTSLSPEAPSRKPTSLSPSQLFALPRNPEALPVPQEPPRSLVTFAAMEPDFQRIFPRFLSVQKVFPTVQESLELSTITSPRTWAGISDELFIRITTALGDTPQSVKQVAIIPYRIWDRSISEIPEQPHPYIDHPLSVGPSPVEWVSIRSFRRAARMISSLPPDKEYQSPTTDNEEHWGPPPLQDLKPTFKLSDLVNPKWDHNVVLLRISTVSAMCERYNKTFGRDPPEDSSPTSDQIAAVKMLYDLRAAPGVDFSLFGPHGNHAISKPTYAAQRWDGETQSYKVRFLAGPSDFDTWFRLWNLFKYTCLLIGSCKTESLDAYSNHIRSFNQEHGQRHWFSILQADFDLRARIFARWVHGEEHRRKALMTSSQLWDFLFRAAADPGYPPPRDIGRKWFYTKSTPILLSSTSHRVPPIA
jgi:hypothetical protein